MRAGKAGFLRTMPRTLKRSNLHFERALGRLPLGVASDCGYWGDDRTLYVKRASGARLWDIDDNEYIDYRLGRGRVILGYAEPRVAKAARAGIEVGGVFALATELEFAVAERIAKLVPAAELVRFSNSGAEAVADALRLARAFTGKDAIAVIDGGSHGLLGTSLREAGQQSRPMGTNPSPGDSRDRGLFDSPIHSVPANDANGFEELLRSHGDQIGTFLIEPIPVDCASVAADLGVRADLCTFGSSMANGFPIAALAGRQEIMRRIGNGVVQGSTYAAHPVSLAVADKTLEIIDKTDALEQIAKYGWRMREGMSQVLSRRGIPHAFVGPPSMSGLCVGDSTPSGDRDRKTVDDAFCADLVPRLHGSGILCEPDFCGSWFVSAAHNELCLAETLAKFEHAADAALERLSDARGRTASAARRLPRPFASPS
jgi:glutamate-1-semialdehyde 2,1-aminomutase